MESSNGGQNELLMHSCALSIRLVSWLSVTLLSTRPASVLINDTRVHRAFSNP
jgi:hypothetical protein